jgi:hypothetical protein
MRFLLALAVTAVSLFADVTGKWTGSFDVTSDGESHNDSAVLILKQDGTNITGTAGPNEEKQFKIQKGSLDGNTLKLEVVNDEDGENNIIHVTLTVDGDKMTGDANAEHDGKKMTAKMALTRQKS